MLDHEFRHIQPTRAGGARPRQQLRYFLAQDLPAGRASEVFTEAADAIEERAADAHVRAEGHPAAVLEHERDVAIVEDRDRAVQRRVQPDRARCLPQRLHRSADIVPPAGKRRRPGAQPAGVNAHIVIGIEDVRSRRVCVTGIERRRASLTRLEDVPQRYGVSSLTRLDDAARVIA
jgi:hypothetical protein